MGYSILMADFRQSYVMVKDLSKIYTLRMLRDLLGVYSHFHIDNIPLPNAYALAADGYRVIACKETNLDTGETYWKSAILFRVVRERRAIWHTIAAVDYILIDPSKKKAFSSISTSLRLLSQFVEKQSKASRLDVVVRLDTQLNATIYLHVRRKLLLEGLGDLGDAYTFMKRLRDIDPKTGKNKVIAPLPTISASEVEGMRPLVQSAILPKRRSNGGLLSFLGHVRRYGREYNKIYDFAEENAAWEHPSLEERVSYMQSVFPEGNGNVKDYIDSLTNDAQFIKLTNPKGNIVALMGMVAGYSTPASTPHDTTWVSPDRVVYVPLVMCQSGARRRWTKVGFMQAQELYKELFSILQSEDNIGRFGMLSCLVNEGSVHAGLLRTVGFKRTATFQTETDGETLSYYALLLDK